jgi:hypothetical protein
VSIPQFTAEATLYRSRRQYRLSPTNSGAPQSDQPITPAYFPGPETMKECYHCTEVSCAREYGECLIGAHATCAASVWLPFLAPVCILAEEGCPSDYVRCLATCVAPVVGDCCPHPCRVPNPFSPGDGCCDAGETCVDENDPNSRGGCCPSGQSVCGGKCCLPGDICSGDACCPPGTQMLCNGVCCAGVCDKDGNCCQTDLCGGKCRPPFNKCCNGQICDFGEECHPTLGTCWAPGGTCAAGQKKCRVLGEPSCCPIDTDCCRNGQCCPSDTCCCPSGEAWTCCPKSDPFCTPR